MLMPVRHRRRAYSLRAGISCAAAVCAALLSIPVIAAQPDAGAPSAPTELLPPSPPLTELEPPRLRSLLEHAWAAESGIGQKRNRNLAADLYCQAARWGSPEGHYRAGVIFAQAGSANAARAIAFFMTAGQFGHARAFIALESLQKTTGPMQAVVPECLTGDPYERSPVLAAGDEDPKPPVIIAQVQKEPEVPTFDLSAYLRSFRPEKARIAGLVAQHASDFGIDPRLALAIASVESNFNPMAVSPKDARGVMQLIPDTAKRFNVKNVHDPVDSIRGGLAYLRWLNKYFAGDVVRVIAAYNAGEGAVDRYRGLPPFDETRMYVRRVLELAGLSSLIPPVAKR